MKKTKEIIFFIYPCQFRFDFRCQIQSFELVHDTMDKNYVDYLPTFQGSQYENSDLDCILTV